MTGWLIQNMVLASAAMLLVLVLRGPAARWLGAGPAYALWAVPALRLVLPPLPQLTPDLPNLVPSETFVVFVGDAAAPLPPDGGPGQWVPWLLALWAGGAAAFLLWQWLGYRRFLAELNRSARMAGAHAGLPLVESEAVEGPVALGLFYRRIVVPADFGRRYNEAERRLALDHEAVHHRRGDLWWNHLGLLILALNWFNPIAWAAFRAFRADQELACDARVTAGAGPDARHDYARALIKSASRPGLIAACPLNHADQLKRRLKMMKTHRQSRTRMLAGAAAVLAFAGGSLAFGSSAGLAQPDPAPPEQAAPPSPHAPGERHEERIIIRTQRVGHGEGGDHAAATEEHHDDATATTRSEHMYVMTTRTEGGRPGERHVGAHGPNGEIEAIVNVTTPVIIPHCDNGQADEIDEGTEGNRTHIVLCSRGNVSPAQRAERLQHARDRIAADSELSAAQKARVTAALDRQIARLRGQ